jgi:hypothetical protein
MKPGRTGGTGNGVCFWPLTSWGPGQGTRCGARPIFDPISTISTVFVPSPGRWIWTVVRNPRARRLSIFTSPSREKHRLSRWIMSTILGGSPPRASRTLASRRPASRRPASRRPVWGMLPQEIRFNAGRRTVPKSHKEEGLQIPDPHVGWLGEPGSPPLASIASAGGMSRGWAGAPRPPPPAPSAPAGGPPRGGRGVPWAFQNHRNR